MNDGTPLPDFMSFDPLTRVLTITPDNKDVGKYFLHVNYDYRGDTDPSTHEHSVPLSIDVVGEIDLSEFFISLDDLVQGDPIPNSTNATNETQPENATSLLNETLSDDLDSLIARVHSPPATKTTQPDPEPLKEPILNITSISETARVTISIDTPVVVPHNITDLPVDIFDV